MRNSDFFLNEDIEEKAKKFIIPEKQKMKYKERHKLALSITQTYPMPIFKIQREEHNLFNFQKSN